MLLPENLTKTYWDHLRPGTLRELARKKRIPQRIDIIERKYYEIWNHPWFQVEFQTLNQLKSFLNSECEAVHRDIYFFRETIQGVIKDVSALQKSDALSQSEKDFCGEVVGSAEEMFQATNRRQASYERLVAEISTNYRKFVVEASAIVQVCDSLLSSIDQIMKKPTKIKLNSFCICCEQYIDGVAQVYNWMHTPVFAHGQFISDQLERMFGSNTQNQLVEEFEKFRIHRVGNILAEVSAAPTSEHLAVSSVIYDAVQNEDRVRAFKVGLRTLAERVRDCVGVHQSRPA